MLFKPVKRLSKRQVKEDKFLIRSAQAWEWVQGNYPKLIGGAVGVVVLLLFVNYLLPFELASFLILAAIIGAVTLAKQKSQR